jgi:hypothetical protein
LAGVLKRETGEEKIAETEAVGEAGSVSAVLRSELWISN